jgi:hypothetical protein
MSHVSLGSRKLFPAASGGRGQRPVRRFGYLVTVDCELPDRPQHHFVVSALLRELVSNGNVGRHHGAI